MHQMRVECGASFKVGGVFAKINEQLSNGMLHNMQASKDTSWYDYASVELVHSRDIPGDDVLVRVITFNHTPSE